ncbi:MAG: peptidylprolyl isomerase [Candidatus Hydrogenedentes bacterium]|nr:peptidylprolyl isomerase [Candidatus Hydrogenedentota bacterium]
MSWESDPVEKDASRDYGRYLWPGIALAACLMIAGLWWAGRESEVGQTRARLHAIHINFNSMDSASQNEALDTITQLRRRIVEGESFSKLAGRYSNDKTTAERDGNWGWKYKVKDDLFDGMGAFVWNGPVNKLSPIIQGRNTYHLIIVKERHLSLADQYEKEIIKRSRNKDANEQSP